MSDFSKLELLVESKNAVQNLNKVQQSLNKTESAANSLKNTLRSIGLGVGFTVLLRQTLQLANSTDALNKRFKTFFGSGGEGEKAVKNLTSNFSLANRSAKELLTTSAKFGTATGMGGQQLTNFSSQLSQLAADVAAFNAIDDVNSVLDRFGAATMGRTQGLREFGVQINTNTEAFKQQVEAIQKQTGATAEQAKQLAILKEAQMQLEYTQGSAGEQVTSAWQQLNNLFTNFKDILSEVGKVFNTIFGPLIRTLNAILEIPFVKSTTAWVIAITTVYVAIGTLIKISRQIGQIVDENTKKRLKESDTYKQLIAAQTKYNRLLAEEIRLRELRDKYATKKEYGNEFLQAMQRKGTTNFKDMYGSPELKKYVKTMRVEIQTSFKNTGKIPHEPTFDELKANIDGLNEKYYQQNLALTQAKSNLTSFKKSFRSNFNTPIVGAINALGLLPPELSSLVLALNMATASTKANTLAIWLNNAAKAINTATTKINTAAQNGASLWKIIGTFLGGTVVALGKWLWKILAPIGKFLWAVIKLAGSFAKAIAIPVLAVIAVYDLTMSIIAAATGNEELLKYTVTHWVVNLMSDVIFWIMDLFGGYTSRAKELDEQAKKLKELQKSMDAFEASYQAYLKSLEQKTLKGQAEAYNRIQRQLKEKQKQIDDANAAIERAIQEADKSDLTKWAEQKKRLMQTRDNYVKEFEKLLEEFEKLKNFPDTLNNIRRNLQGAIDQFAIDTSIFYDKKTGKLIDRKNATALAIAQADVKRFTQEFQNALKGNKSLDVINASFERLKKAQLDAYRYRMQQLEDEKQKLIEQQNAVKELIGSAVGYQKTSVQGVAANSMQALELQTREKTAPDKSLEKQVAMSSDKIAAINKQQADLAQRSYDRLSEFVKKFDTYMTRNTSTNGKRMPDLIVINYR